MTGLVWVVERNHLGQNSLAQKFCVGEVAMSGDCLASLSRLTRHNQEQLHTCARLRQEAGLISPVLDRGCWKVRAGRADPNPRQQRSASRNQRSQD